MAPEETPTPERQTRHAPWRLLLALALAGVLLYTALHGVDWMQVWHTVARARWQYLVGACFIK